MRLAADASRDFSGIELDRAKPLRFTLDGRPIDGFVGDTVLSATLAAGIDTYGTLGETSLGLGERFGPLIASATGTPLPIDRVPVIDGGVYATIGPRNTRLFKRPRTLGHRLDGRSVPAWTGVAPSQTLSADVLVVGGGVAGLSAADAAATAGKSVILVERRPWLGGDGRYFGPVGDEESPATLTTGLIDRLRGLANVQLLPNAEAYALGGETTLVHQIIGDGMPLGRVTAISAPKIVLATGSAQRLPVFAGNRQPGVISTVSAYNLAKRYGVVLGGTALIATQSNYGYRLALRLHDAGVGIRRIVDTRINAQSRFVDFAKASGLSLGTGQLPIAVTATRQGLSVAFANAGTSHAATNLEANSLIVSGGFQPELSLWMLAGGGVRWFADRLEAQGHLDHVALAGSALGYMSLQACGQSGRSAVAQLFGEAAPPVEDSEIDAAFETPDAATAMAPAALGIAFLDMGESLVRRPANGTLTPGQAFTTGDVTAAVALGMIAPSDAAAIAEERGAPGNPLAQSKWSPVPQAAPEMPAFLTDRFGSEPRRLNLVAGGTRIFEIGALIYRNTGERYPLNAIGVIVASADFGGIALIDRTADTDRFIVETMSGPSPARVRG